MRRMVPGLHNSANDLEGLFLVRVERAGYQWHPHRPFFTLVLRVLKPDPFSGRFISARLYSSPRALWKLSWFLRDFGYDSELLGSDQVDEKALLGLQGIVRISYTLLGGRRLLNLERFAPAADWDELS